MRRTVSAVVGLAICLGAGTARAQDFGDSMTVVFSADRLFGLHFSNRTTENPPNADRKLDATTVEIGWTGSQILTPFDIPRFAFDIFVIDGLSVGGALGYATSSIELENGDEASANDLIFAPRVGYVWMFSDVAGFWLRGGLTYHRSEFQNDWDDYGLAFTVDPAFVLSPVDNFAFLAGVNADIDIIGEESFPNNPDVDRRYRSIGIQLGLLGYL